ncbi:hypothetical protein THIOM_002603 [Candidatus Thiomargarita nelsonii]|uniref:Uncharacterized protein n=1 Tax=Candidatus Thiomargarita nelsonii TaxID=1003181 RepID=A0A0A6RL78_9GAMM|nr:hypothetical protein THIOM_002603 [Candidatus Thiomargarita nelsonii]
MNEEQVTQYQKFLQIEDPTIWETIRYLLNYFDFVNQNANEQTVWKAHKNVLINHLSPLYDSLNGIDFDKHLKRIGLTKNVKQAVFTKRTDYLIRRITEDKFPIPVDSYEIQAFKTLIKALLNWVSDTSCQIPANLPAQSVAKFQVYIAYEALYIWLRSINLARADEIDPRNFYRGIYDWLGKTKLGVLQQHGATPAHMLQWTQILNAKTLVKHKILDKKTLTHHKMTCLAIFSKLIHLFLGKAEEACTQDKEKRLLFFNTLANEMGHLAPEDIDGVLEEISKRMISFADEARNAKANELGNTKRGNPPQKWCNSPLFRFWGLAFCNYIYEAMQKLFPQQLELQTNARDVLVKPLSNEHKRIKNLLEAARGVDQKVEEMMELIDRATLPEFRYIWNILDNCQ